jgi:hypothetical protein
MPATPSNAQFASIAQFVNFAYQISANSTPGGPIPILPAGFPTDYALVAFIQAPDDFLGYPNPAYYGFVVYSAAKKHVLVAIRGTWFVVEWLLDLDAPMVKFVPRLGNETGITDAGYVEEGFNSVFTTMTFTDANNQPVDVLAYLKQACADPAVKVDFVAHSLGGAITALLAATVGYFAPAVAAASTVTTFAAPAPGDDGFGSFYTTNAPNTYRIWNGLDPVPSALYLLGYSQAPEPGIGITPTWEQLFEYDSISIVCNHSLMTYQWLLDSSWPLDSGCLPWSIGSPNPNAEVEQQATAARTREEMKPGSIKHRV